jgi:protein-disulfide isomerase
MRDEVAEALVQPTLRLRLLLVGTASLAGALFIHGSITATTSSQASEQRLLDWYAAVQATPAATPLSLEFFTDYQCPSCRVLVPQYRAVAQSALDRLADGTLTTRHFPLDTACNPFIPPDENVHPAACSASAAVLVATESHGDEVASALEDWLYGHQIGLSESAIESRMAELGLAAEYRTNRDRHTARIQADIEDGRRLGVVATPTIVINGVRLPPLAPLGFDQILAFELERRLRGSTEPAVTPAAR